MQQPQWLNFYANDVSADWRKTGFADAHENHYEQMCAVAATEIVHLIARRPSGGIWSG